MLTLVWDNTRSLITGREIRVRLAVKRREKERGKRAVDPAKVEEEKPKEEEEEKPKEEEEVKEEKPKEDEEEEVKEEVKPKEEEEKPTAEEEEKEEEKVITAAPENATATECIVCLK